MYLYVLVLCLLLCRVCCRRNSARSRVVHANIKPTKFTAANVVLIPLPHAIIPIT